MTTPTKRRGPPLGKPPNQGKPCSLAEFRRLWHDMSLTVPDIAARLGVTEKTVTVRAKACGFTPRTALRGAARNSFDAEFPALWIFGVSAEEIGRHYGVTPGAAHMRAHRMGITAAGRNISRWNPGRSIAEFRQVQMAGRMARTAAAESKAVAERWRAAA